MEKNHILLNLDKSRRYLNIAQGDMLKLGMVNESFALVSIYERLLKLTEKIEKGEKFPPPGLHRMDRP